MNLWKLNQGLLPSGGLARSGEEEEDGEEDAGEGEEERSGRGGSHPATGADDHVEAEEVFIFSQPPFHSPSLSTLSVRTIQIQ